MVPGERLNSNLLSTSSAQLTRDNPSISSKFETLNSPENSSELFETLANWNEILEKQAHHFE